MTKRATFLLALLAGLLLALPAGAQESASPQPVSSEPAAGSEQHQAPGEVTIEFDSPLDPSSKLTVTDECGERVDSGATSVSGSSMRVATPNGPQGTWTVNYLAVGLGGVTGSSEGSYTFAVHLGPKCGKSGGGGGGGNHDHGGDKDKGGNGKSHSGHGGGGDGSTSTHSDDHTTSNHTTGTHSAASSSHSDHAGSDKGKGKKKGGGHGHHHQKNKKASSNEVEAEPDTVATGPAGFGDPAPADGAAVLVALGVSGVLGALGGLFLRINSLQ